MNMTQQEKFQDYLDGFVRLEVESSVPVGAVVVDADARSLVLKELKRSLASVITEDPDTHEDVAIRDIVGKLSKGKLVATDLRTVSPKFLQLLSQVSAGRIGIQLAGEAALTVVNPLPKGARLLCITDDAGYGELAKLDTITSVCRLVE
jgi:hypothetical protein